MRLFVRFAFCVSFAVGMPFAIGAPTSFGNRVLDVPAPSGYVPISTRAPTFFAAAQNYMPPANRLVEFYASPKDAGRMEDDDAQPAARYFQLMTLHKSDASLVSPAQFKPFLTAMEHEAAALNLPDRVSALVDKGNAKTSRELGVDPKFAVTNPNVLGIYRRENWGTFFAARSSAAAGDHPSVHDMASASAITLINHKVVVLVTWTRYSSPADLVWAKAALDTWVKAIRDANPDSDA